MDGLEQSYGTRLSFMRVDFNSTSGRQLAAYYEVRGHPTIVLVDGAGMARATLIGVPKRERVEEAISEVIR